MILVTGSEGQVGYALMRALAPLGDVKGLSRADGDLADQAVVEALLERYKPRCIINAAAYTAVDKAESEPELADALNHQLPATLADWASRHQALLVHYSTDYVYDGSGDQPWKESDATGPLSVYGKSKLAGDQAVLAGLKTEGAAAPIIFRTSWVYGARGHNFMLTMLKLAAQRDKLTVVADQWGTPTPAWLIAQVTAIALRERLRGNNDVAGVYHLTCHGETTWCDFAKAIIAKARLLGADLKMTEGAVFPIPSSDYPAPAPRPANSRLDVSLLEQSLGLTLPGWDQALYLTLQDWHERSSFQ